ncbi:hypothetical protein H632_c3670p0, partial [Helicosporidium sp. ATCC 50920]
MAGSFVSSQSLASTLQLLPASTKAVVASAFVGLGVELVYKARNPALCFTYREPIDADVFEASAVGTPSVALALEVGEAAQSSAKLMRPTGRQAFLRVTATRNICLTFARNEGICVLLVLNRYFAD